MVAAVIALAAALAGAVGALIWGARDWKRAVNELAATTGGIRLLETSLAQSEAELARQQQAREVDARRAEEAKVALESRCNDLARRLAAAGDGTGAAELLRSRLTGKDEDADTEPGHRRAATQPMPDAGTPKPAQHPTRGRR